MRQLISLILIALTTWPAQACTLWAAAGDAAEGGTLISKNRDWKPDHHQYLKLVTPKKGLRYFGLYAEGNDEPGLKAGVNEMGLTIISASSNIPRKIRDNQPDKRGIMISVLSKYASIDALMVDADKVFKQSRANFFLISDRSKVLEIEVGLEGKYSIKTADNGLITHTNHYLDPQLAALYNNKIGPSSATRYQRINEILGQSSAPYALENFAKISRDQHDGADNSLWRSGKEHTMASWIVRAPASGAPKLRVVINNPNEAETTQEFTLDDAFWQQEKPRR